MHVCAGRTRCGPRVRVDGPATVTEQVCAGRLTKMPRPDACPVFPGPASAGSRDRTGVSNGSRLDQTGRTNPGAPSPALGGRPWRWCQNLQLCWGLGRAPQGL